MTTYTKAVKSLNLNAGLDNTSFKIAWPESGWFRVLQHLAFWVLSFYVFVALFKISSPPQKIDFVYAALCHAFIVPPVYINLSLLIPWLKRSLQWYWYTAVLLLLVAFFAWLQNMFFSVWSNAVLPDYFFISYYNFAQTALIFIVYLAVTALIKLSKSWFLVSELQRELLFAEKQKSAYEKDLLQMEAMALRAQMNPHFVFNCLNSIKSLIQKDEKEKAIDYLTIFSKLIRNLFQNADKRQVSLYEELDNCRHYVQLESMRLGAKLYYDFKIDPGIDLKSVMVPALIVQPFIENAIWHGIVPNEKNGHLMISVYEDNDQVVCEVDDDGIGRQLSKANKTSNTPLHESRGVRLSEARLGLEKMLNEKENSIRIIDKFDGNAATGTKVIIQFNLQ